MPLSQILEAAYLRVRCGVGGVRPRRDVPEAKGYDPAKATDTHDDRWLGKYFRVGMTRRGRK